MFKFLGLSIAAAIIVPSVAFASPISLTRSQHVGYADLDLATAAGQGQLRRRLAAAVKNVCRDDDQQSFSIDEMNECRQSTWQVAYKQLRTVTEFAVRNSGAPVLLAAR